MTIYRILRTGKISAKLAEVLARAIEAVTFREELGPPCSLTENRPPPIPCRIDIRAFTENRPRAHLGRFGGDTIRRSRLKS
jgi:hypothetical protein